jgi:very-short-patch-repair endonuclease
MSELNHEYILKAYDQNKSTYDIAKEFNTYPGKIRRILIKYGKILRSKSEAQKNALKTGKHKHPTKGHRRPEAIRIRISAGVSKAWDNLSETDKQQRIEFAREQWAKLSEDDKLKLRKLAGEAVREAAEKGSKLEQYLLLGLRLHGFMVEFHRENIVAREKLQVDLFLPNEGIAIEIDGPAHFYPIWGEESLIKHIKSDTAKSGLIIQAGLVLIRLKVLAKNVNKSKQIKILNQLVSLINNIKSNFPGKDNRLIEIEVK